MKPIKFGKLYSVVAKGYEHERVGTIVDLDIHVGDDGALYSSWKPSWQERLMVLIGKPIVVGVLAKQQPPITLLVGEEHVP